MNMSFLDYYINICTIDMFTNINFDQPLINLLYIIRYFLYIFSFTPQLYEQFIHILHSPKIEKIIHQIENTEIYNPFNIPVYGINFIKYYILCEFYKSIDISKTYHYATIYNTLYVDISLFNLVFISSINSVAVIIEDSITIKIDSNAKYPSIHAIEHELMNDMFFINSETSVNCEHVITINDNNTDVILLRDINNTNIIYSPLKYLNISFNSNSINKHDKVTLPTNIISIKNMDLN